MDDRRISKSLSFWLRHRPAAADLSLNREGWAEVGAVLAALKGKGLDVSAELLAQVVAGNDKQRFELSADAAWIRARQGHSVAVEADWRDAPPPDMLYHGTIEAALAAIRAEGLRPMRRHHVHLSPDRVTALKVGSRRGAPVVLTVRAGEMGADGHRFFVTGNGVWLAESVAPRYIDFQARGGLSGTAPGPA